MSDVRDTAPAGSTKPAACGACGATRFGAAFRDREVDGKPRKEYQLLCACGVAGPWVPCNPAQNNATDAWNRMWAPRAGEATRKVMERALHFHKEAVRLGFTQHSITFYRSLPGEMSYFHSFADFEAMCLELGLAGGEGRG